MLVISGPLKDCKGSIVRLSSTGVLLLERAFNPPEQLGIAWIWLGSLCKWVLQCLALVIEGSLEVKLPTIWTDGKAEVRRVQEEK